jgi:hypothetical protein
MLEPESVPGALPRHCHFLATTWQPDGNELARPGGADSLLRSGYRDVGAPAAWSASVLDHTPSAYDEVVVVKHRSGVGWI